MTTEEDCFFCKSEPNDLSESGNFYARLDHFPVSRGHTHIVPRQHIVSFFDLAPEQVAEMYDLMRSIYDWLVHRYKPDAFTIGINDGAAAGRTVNHLHVHLIPRYTGDVPDPRGGIRNIFPDAPHPDQWSRS